MPTCAGELFFSEYLEGTTGQNKAVEIYNGSGSPVDLADGQFLLQIYANGNLTPNAAIALNGTINHDTVFVLAHPTANPTVVAQADQTSGSVSFSGDDAVVLRKNGANGSVLDVIGQVGNDPGDQWGTDPVSTQNNVIRRKPSVDAGDTNPNDAYNPAPEWDGFVDTDYSGFGAHAIECGPTPTPTPTITGTPPSSTPTATISGFVRISDIQGTGTVSPYEGDVVTTSGIVTARKSGGFFIQMAPGEDTDPQSSDAILVFTSSAPPAAAAVGNRVQVSGTVVEFRPDDDTNSPPMTQLIGVTVSNPQPGQSLPPPLTLTAADTSPSGSIEQLERFEAMRVHVDSLTATAPTQGSINEANATVTSNGVFFGVLPGIPRPFREPGVEAPDPIPPNTTTSPCCPPRFDANPERLRIDSDGQSGGTRLEVTAGATVSNITGVLDYVFRAYTILPDPTAVPVVSGSRSVTPLPTPAPDQLTIASFNMQRFFDSSDDPSVGDPVLTSGALETRLTKASDFIRNVLRTPDVVGVQEMENLAILLTLATRLSSDAINAGQPDPGYQAYLEEGNDFGGIDVGLLVRDRVVVMNVSQENKNETYVNPQSGATELLNDRPPLRLDASIPVSGHPDFEFTVVVAHQRSLTGVDDDNAPDDDGISGPRVREKRGKQAESLARLAQSLQSRPGIGAHLVIVGDFNAFQFSDGYVDVVGTVRGQPSAADTVVYASADLVNPDLTDVIDFVAPAPQQYSYSFDGNAQVLDHILVSEGLVPRVAHIQYAHGNSDFPDSYYANSARPERLSDHDPPVVYLALADLPPTRTVTPSPTRTATPTATRTATPPAGGTSTPTPNPLPIHGPSGLVPLHLAFLGAALILARRRNDAARSA